jgi:hypothetical protein
MEWPEPWQPVEDPEEGLALEAELARELSAPHPLYGLPVAVVGRRIDCDDVLFRLLDGTGRYALVHLTYCDGQEQAPWPGTTLYERSEDWFGSTFYQSSEWSKRRTKSDEPWERE